MSPTTAPVTLIHLGGPSVVLDYAGLRIVSDPTFDPAGSTYKVSGLLPVTKTTDPALTAEQLGDVHAVLVSHHGHADNLDAGGRDLVRTVARRAARSSPTPPPPRTSTAPAASRPGNRPSSPRPAASS